MRDISSAVSSFLERSAMYASDSYDVSPARRNISGSLAEDMINYSRVKNS